MSQEIRLTSLPGINVPLLRVFDWAGNTIGEWDLEEIAPGAYRTTALDPVPDEIQGDYIAELRGDPVGTIGVDRIKVRGGAGAVTYVGETFSLSDIVTEINNALTPISNKLTTVSNKLGDWAGTGRDTLLAAFQSVFRKDPDATLPPSINQNLGSGTGTATNVTDSLQGVYDRVNDGSPDMAEVLAEVRKIPRVGYRAHHRNINSTVEVDVDITSITPTP